MKVWSIKWLYLQLSAQLSFFSACHFFLFHDFWKKNTCKSMHPATTLCSSFTETSGKYFLEF